MNIVERFEMKLGFPIESLKSHGNSLINKQNAMTEGPKREKGLIMLASVEVLYIMMILSYIGVNVGINTDAEVRSKIQRMIAAHVVTLFAAATIIIGTLFALNIQSLI